MDRILRKNRNKKRRRVRVRKKVFGTAECPRLSVFRSARHIYCQLIDDTKGVTLASASTMLADVRSEHKNGGNKAAAVAVGTLIAQRAKEIGVEKIVFDRGPNKFHGRVKAMADKAREGGLVF